MHVVEPQAFIMAEMGCLDGTRDFLNAIGAQDWNCPIDVGSDNELLVEVAGRTCYKSFGTGLNKNITRVRSNHKEYIGNILETKHGSVLEHASTTVGLANISRILTHELVRHRAGCAYSQESMRFVRLEDVGMYIPDCIANDYEARTLFCDAAQAAEGHYTKLTQQLIKDDMPFSKKKEITSAIRRIAPSGHATNLVITANHRAWRHLIELRTANGVEEEIGVVFDSIANQFASRYPAFYQDMFMGDRLDSQKWVTWQFKNSKI